MQVQKGKGVECQRVLQTYKVKSTAQIMHTSGISSFSQRKQVWQCILGWRRISGLVDYGVYTDIFTKDSDTHSVSGTEVGSADLWKSNETNQRTCIHDSCNQINTAPHSSFKQWLCSVKMYEISKRSCHNVTVFNVEWITFDVNDMSKIKMHTCYNKHVIETRYMIALSSMSIRNVQG